MDKKIFFSYGHDKYAKYVQKVKVYLEEKGYSVFFDEDELQGSADWEAKLEEGLKDNDKVVFFITPHSARRPDGYCLNELAMALTYKRDIVPVMLAYEVPPLSIVRQQYLDMESCFTEDGLDEVLFEKHMENLLQVLEGNKELDFEGAQAKVFEELNPLDTTADFAKHKHIIGREWIIDEVDHWVEEYPNSKVLWITAEAGYGKSALAVYLANNHPDVAGIHFCNYNRPNTKDAKQVVKTLAYHLQARQLDGYFDAIKYIDTKDKNAAELFNELIANPLNRSKYKDENNLFIVIDALDETLDDPEEELIDLIGSYEFEVGLPDFVKIIVISRPDARLEETLSGLNTIELNVQEKKNEEDCIEFINFRLEQLKQDKYKIDTELVETVLNDEKIIKSIVENSGANMLYLNKFFEEVEKRNIDLSEPDTFPKGLNGIYKGFFKRVTTDKEKYDDVYAPILEVILTYGEPIPRLLLGDILGIELKPFNRAMTNLGTMIKEDDSKVDIYHKSLKDWLVSDTNKTYFADIKDGEKKIQIFIEKLTQEDYKEEYLSFEYLNKMLIDTAYEKDENLNSYFELLSLIKDEKKKIELLRDLGEDYTLYNRMYKAVELQEMTYELTKDLYLKDQEQWAEDYTDALRNLGNIYSKSNKSNEAIIYVKKSYLILKVLYEDNKKYWVKKYTKVLRDLSYIYYLSSKTKEALALSKENFQIVKSLYIQNKEYWIRSYMLSCDNLARLYQEIGQFDEALKLGKINLETIRVFYENDKEHWSRSYAATLNNLGHTYKMLEQNNEALLLEKKSLDILKPLYKENKAYWVEEYTVTLNNLANTYKEIGQYTEALHLAKEKFLISKVLFSENEERWADSYTMALNNLASTYYFLKNKEKALSFEKDNFKILKSLYQKNNERWVKNYILSLNNLANYYKEIGESKEALDYFSERYLIISTLYREDEERWIDDYISVLNSLVYLYENIHHQDKAKKFMKEYRLIKKKHKNMNKITPQTAEKEPNRNDPCPCGSGKKYKKCCGKN